ncbi:MAG: DUF4920 domain-containing protein [Phycisphaerae bacterium]
MLRSRRIAAICVVGLLASSGCSIGHADFGEPMKLTAWDTIAVSKVLADMEAYDGRYVRLSGKVSGVCAAKGCWMRMGTDRSDETVFVKFNCPIEGRLIPMEAIGHQAIVEGTLRVAEVSQAEARHYAEDAGKSPDQIAGIVGGQKQLRMTSPAARVTGIAPKAPPSG